MGVCARGAFKNLGPPTYFLLPLKLATSNLVYNLGLGITLQLTIKTLVSNLVGTGWATGAPNKKLCCCKEAARCFVSVQLLYTLEWCGYPMVKKNRTYVYSF